MELDNEEAYGPPFATANESEGDNKRD